MKLGSPGFTPPCLLILGKKYSSEKLFGFCNCSVGISAVVFCSMMLRDEGVLRGYLLPGSAVVGALSLNLIEVASDSCWSQVAISGLVLLVTQLIYTKFLSNNCALLHLW